MSKVRAGNHVNRNYFGSNQVKRKDEIVLWLITFETCYVTWINYTGLDARYQQNVAATLAHEIKTRCEDTFRDTAFKGKTAKESDKNAARA